jgi:hypothetical protein
VADLTALQVQHPEWNLVDAMDAPNGGTWALGADGGVFALDGAPFFGSYWNIAPEGRQGTRAFRRIEFNPASGGYSLISDRGERYEAQFGDPNYKPPGTEPAATTTPPPGTPAPPVVDANQVSLAGLLKTMDLGTLIDKAWTFWTDMGATATMEAVNIWIRDQPEFKAKFPAMDYLQSQGKYWTPADYMKYTQSVDEAMSRAGIPKEFWNDPGDYAKLIQNNWSIDEVADAVDQAEDAVLNLPPDVRAQMQEWGLTDGDMRAYWLNPDKGKTLAQRRQAQQAAGVGATSTRSGFGPLTEAQATGLVQTVGAEAATSGVQAMGQLAPVFAETVGETMAGEDLTQETGLGAIKGEAASTAAIRRRQGSRKAAFEGGGGAAGGGGAGTTGLGSSR